MAALDLEEQEQLAEMKAWWQRYGNLVLSALTLVCLIIAGYNGWIYYQRTQSAAAAQVFEGVQKLAGGGDAKKVSEASKALAEQFPRTTFAVMGQLMAARVAFDANDAEMSRSHLQWVIDNGRDDELKHVARVRLSGILLDQKKFDEALKLLDTAHPDHFEAAYADRRGDILYAQGKPGEARTAWQTAMAKAGATATLKSALEFKLELVGAAPAPSRS
jgi:predicted negative regulator of RcsB-dependent stress response